MTDHSDDDDGSSSEISQFYYQLTSVLKCFGLYPLFTDRDKQTHFGYQVLNILAILTAVSIYGYVLVSHSLESEIIRLNTGSVIIQRMLDIFHIAQYVMAVVVPVFALLALDHTRRMLRGLDEVNRSLLDSGGRSIAQALAGTGKLVRILQLVAFGFPVFCMVIFIVVGKIRRYMFAMCIIVRLTKFVCYCSYAQLWIQPTMLLMLIRARFAALNRIVRCVEGSEKMGLKLM